MRKQLDPYLAEAMRSAPRPQKPRIMPRDPNAATVAQQTIANSLSSDVGRSTETLLKRRQGIDLAGLRGLGLNVPIF